MHKKTIINLLYISKEFRLYLRYVEPEIAFAIKKYSEYVSLALVFKKIKYVCVKGFNEEIDDMLIRIRPNIYGLYARMYSFLSIPLPNCLYRINEMINLRELYPWRMGAK